MLIGTQMEIENKMLLKNKVHKNSKPADMYIFRKMVKIMRLGLVSKQPEQPASKF